MTCIRGVLELRAPHYRAVLVGFGVSLLTGVDGDFAFQYIAEVRGFDIGAKCDCSHTRNIRHVCIVYGIQLNSFLLWPSVCQGLGRPFASTIVFTLIQPFGSALPNIWGAHYRGDDKVAAVVISSIMYLAAAIFAWFAGCCHSRISSGKKLVLVAMVLAMAGCARMRHVRHSHREMPP